MAAWSVLWWQMSVTRQARGTLSQLMATFSLLEKRCFYI